MKNYFKSVSIILALVLGLAGAAIAQETYGNIEGTVKDQAGAVVPNVSITITNKASGAGFKRVVTTNNDGYYRVVQVPAGIYSVTTAPISGFSAATYDNVTVTTGNS